jgi:hypothetical protein
MIGYRAKTLLRTAVIIYCGRHFHLSIILMLFLVGCSSQIIDNKRSHDNLSESKTIRLSFKPSAGETYIKETDINNLFEKAKETGLILDYKTLFLLLNQQYGKITFTKEKGNNVPIIVEVIVTVSDNKQMAYVFLTVNSNTKEAVDSAIFKFKEMYKSTIR